MKAVVQRVSSSKVVIEEKIVGQIEKGFNVLLGIGEDDNMEDVEYLVKKITNLRVFQDKEDKMNLSIKDVNGQMLIISQFTLLASTKKGNRPSFIKAMKPIKANELYECFISKVKEEGIKVQKGEFGADMSVSIINDGPVTIIYDTKNKE